MTAPITLIASGDQIMQKKDRVETILRDLGSVLVAFSGGADSALLLRIAHDVLDRNAAGVIAVSESIPAEEVEAAVAVARELEFPDDFGLEARRKRLSPTCQQTVDTVPKILARRLVSENPLGREKSLDTVDVLNALSD